MAVDCLLPLSYERLLWGKQVLGKNIKFLRLINLGDSHTTNFDQKAIRGK